MSYIIFKPNGKKLYFNDKGHLSSVKFYPEYNEEKSKGIKYKIFGGMPGAEWQYYLYQVNENNVLYDVFESTIVTREWFVAGTVELCDRFCNGIAHRKNGPAFEHYQDYDVWYENGKRHRVGAPAYQKGTACKDGEEWYIDGQLHRENAPAAICKNDGPAWDGKHYYQNGKLHRLDGPAQELDNGDLNWYYLGQKLECKNQEEFEKTLRLKIFW